MELRVFRVSFKLYYRELCDWNSEYLKAANKRGALRKFAKKHHVPEADLSAPEKWRWWEEDWYYAFHGITEVPFEPKRCTLCEGTGVLLGQSAGRSK